MSQPVEAFIGIGSNLGDREHNIATALAILGRTAKLQLQRVSDLIETAAVGGPPDSPPYLNAVARVSTTLGPQRLLARLLEIEKNLGRERRIRWEPRPIDLDILLFGDEVISSPELAVPHPLMHDRRFVLEPLVQIAPDVMHPVLKKTARELLQSLN